MHCFIKFLLNTFIYIIAVYGGFCAVAHACESNEIDVFGDGSQCKTTKFTITTIELVANDEFTFYISAAGTFYIDCGTNGTLSGNGVSGKKIRRIYTSNDSYTCTYTTDGTKNIRLSGLATEYNSGVNMATIKFGNSDTTYDATPELVYSVSGSLGALFPTLGQSSTQKPNFIHLFKGASNLTSISNNLFSGITSGVSVMFLSAFQDCNALSEIPAGLFDSIQTPAQSNMFRDTFKNCTSLNNLPSGLFAGITGAADNLFRGTFTGCSGLQSIPSNLFSGLSGAANSMFLQTFVGCSSLNEIPYGLFDGVTGSAAHLFQDTFRSCTSLTSIPDRLFSGITDAATYEFQQTFIFCTNLRGYIPASLFAGLNNSGKYDTYMMSGTFGNTSMLTKCPTGTHQFVTGYESYWEGRVACEPNTITINWDGAESGTCTYGGTITTPTTPPTRRGYTFVGWTFEN